MKCNEWIPSYLFNTPGYHDQVCFTLRSYPGHVFFGSLDFPEDLEKENVRVYNDSPGNYKWEDISAVMVINKPAMFYISFEHGLALYFGNNGYFKSQENTYCFPTMGGPIFDPKNGETYKFVDLEYVKLNDLQDEDVIAVTPYKESQWTPEYYSDGSMSREETLQTPSEILTRVLINTFGDDLSEYFVRVKLRKTNEHKKEK